MPTGDLLKSTVECGDLEEVLTIITRLQDFLPEYGRTKDDEAFSKLWKAVEDLEKQLTIKRALMREQALRIVEKAKRSWSPSEMEKATGYETT